MNARDTLRELSRVVRQLPNPTVAMGLIEQAMLELDKLEQRGKSYDAILSALGFEDPANYLDAGASVAKVLGECIADKASGVHPDRVQFAERLAAIGFHGQRVGSRSFSQES